MEWYQVGTIVISNLGLFLWAVRQSRNDYLNCQKSIESFTNIVNKQMQDFHGKLERIDCEFKIRLYEIEKKNVNK